MCTISCSDFANFSHISQCFPIWLLNNQCGSITTCQSKDIAISSTITPTICHWCIPILPKMIITKGLFRHFPWNVFLEFFQWHISLFTKTSTKPWTTLHSNSNNTIPCVDPWGWTRALNYVIPGRWRWWLHRKGTNASKIDSKLYCWADRQRQLTESQARFE